jgi:hypothetical protein
MKRFAVIAAVLIAACSTSSDYDEPRTRPARVRAAQAREGALDMLPPAQWWHDPQIAAAVSLSPDQFAQLDKIAKEHEDEIARLERDSMTAARDVRTLLDTEQPAAPEIVTAAMRLRAIRDSAFEHQAQLLAAERALLTKRQWESLQSAMQSERQDRRDRGNAYPRRRGGRGGGRWPGM